MRVGLIDVDGKGFPNIALMKISAYHKARGDEVEWYNPMFSGHMDKVYMSKVFSFTPDYDFPIDADEIECGGTGYCISVGDDGREHYNALADHSCRTRSSISIPITIYIPNLRGTLHTDI